MRFLNGVQGSSYTVRISQKNQGKKERVVFGAQIHQIFIQSLIVARNVAEIGYNVGFFELLVSDILHIFALLQLVIVEHVVLLIINLLQF